MAIASVTVSMSVSEKTGRPMNMVLAQQTSLSKKKKIIITGRLPWVWPGDTYMLNETYIC